MKTETKVYDRYREARRVAAIYNARDKAREAVSLLRGAGASKAADYVARSLKSVDGAIRHAEGMMSRKERAVAAAFAEDAKGGQ